MKGTTRVAGAALTVTAVAATLLSGGGIPVAAQGETVTITDFRGRTMDIPVKPERVVFTIENALNTWYALDAGSNVVGLMAPWEIEYKEKFYDAVNPGWRDIPIVATDEGVADLEAMAAADPDLVVLWSGEENDPDTVAITEALGIPVYGLELRSFADLSKMTTDMAAIMGDPVRGAEISEAIAKLQKKVTDVSETIPVDERPTVYWMWDDVFGTAGTNSTGNELIESAGGRNIMSMWDDPSASQEHPVLSLETLAALNPDVIYLWFNQEIDPSDIIEGKQAGGFDFAPWKEIAAVKNGRVFELDDPFLYDFMTARQPIASLKIAKDISPEAFADVDIESEYDAYFRSVYGVTYPDYQPAD